MTAESARLTTVLDDAAPDILRYFERRIVLDDAPDALGEVMIAAWRRVAHMPRDHEQARMWLFGIAHNVLANSTRAERRHSKLTDRLRSALASARSEADAADEGLDVRDAIARLPTNQIELVRLIHWEGFTIAAAAEMLGIPASTARTRYQTARETLRVALTNDSARPDLPVH